MLVVEVLELPERLQEMALVPNDHAVQELMSARLHPAFHNRIHSRHLDRVNAHILETGTQSYRLRTTKTANRAKNPG